MEQQDIKITPQDIIDKEFRVKFRGFDMAEVDSFLEEVAENLFKLTEENTVLNEKILALQQDLEAAVSTVPQIEFPEELENNLEDLKHDIAAISADLASLKQDRPSFDPIVTTASDSGSRSTSKRLLYHSVMATRSCVMPLDAE